ncbi:hypothetical protein [Nocardiopsis oceani]
MLIAAFLILDVGDDGPVAGLDEPFQNGDRRLTITNFEIGISQVDTDHGPILPDYVFVGFDVHMENLGNIERHWTGDEITLRFDDDSIAARPHSEATHQANRGGRDEYVLGPGEEGTVRMYFDVEEPEQLSHLSYRDRETVTVDLGLR